MRDFRTRSGADAFRGKWDAGSRQIGLKGVATWAGPSPLRFGFGDRDATPVGPRVGKDMPHGDGEKSGFSKLGQVPLHC
jgi:hypothetical protein